MCLTVKESLMYASKLKNSGYHGKVDHEANIKSILEDLMLDEIIGQRVDTFFLWTLWWSTKAFNYRFGIGQC